MKTQSSFFSSNLSVAEKPQSAYPYNYFALSLLALGAVLRLVGLGARPFWFDETISVIYAHQDIPTLFALNSGDNHPVGYYLTLKGWLALFGDSETAVRLLSVGPGLVSIWLTWLLARRLFPNELRVGLLGVALMAVSPFQIYFSQEARNYSFMEMWVLLAIWFWLRGLQNNRWQDWVGFGAATAFGLVFNLTTAFYVAALGIVMLVTWRKRWQDDTLGRFILAGAGGAAVASVALLPKLNRLQAIKGNFWVPTPDLLIVLRTFYTFIFGAVPTALFVPAFALSFVLLFLVLFQVGLSLVRKSAQIQPTTFSQRNLTFWLLFGPLGLVFVVSLLFQPIYLDKALIGCAPFYYLLLGWLIFQNDKKRLAGRVLAFGTPLVLAVGLALVTLPQLYNGTINPLYIARYDAPRINTYLAQRFQPDDAIATATDISLLPLIYYDSNLPKYQLAEYPYPNVFPALLQQVGSAFVPQADFAKKYKRLWLVFEINAPEDALKAPPRLADLTIAPTWFHSPVEQQRTLDWFNAHYTRQEAIYLDRVLIVLYQLN